MDIKASLWRVLLTNYWAFVSSTFLFAFWKYVLSWPAPWITAILIFRATYLSLIHFHKFDLHLDGSTLTGPSGPTYTRKSITISPGLVRIKTMGLTQVRDESGAELWYRDSWFPKSKIEQLNRILILAELPK